MAPRTHACERLDAVGARSVGELFEQARADPRLACASATRNAASAAWCQCCPRILGERDNLAAVFGDQCKLGRAVRMKEALDVTW